MRFSTILPAAVLGATLVSGCTHTPEPVPLGPDPFEVALAESAARAAVAQGELARIQAARTAPAPRPFDENMTGVPAEMRRPIDIAWSGPGVDAARRIAGIVGYRFRVVGNPPSTPLFVDLDESGTPAVKVLEDLGYQVAPFAQVVVDARTRRVEYRFVDGLHASRRTRMSK